MFVGVFIKPVHGLCKGLTCLCRGPEMEAQTQDCLCICWVSLMTYFTFLLSHFGFVFYVLFKCNLCWLFPTGKYFICIFIIKLLYNIEIIESSENFLNKSTDRCDLALNFLCWLPWHYFHSLVENMAVHSLINHLCQNIMLKLEGQMLCSRSVFCGFGSHFEKTGIIDDTKRNAV